MRGSKAKKIRKFAEMTKAPKATVYDPLKPIRIFAKPPFQMSSAVFLGHVTMRRECVRAIYQNMKKRYRLANQFERRMP